MIDINIINMVDPININAYVNVNELALVNKVSTNPDRLNKSLIFRTTYSGPKPPSLSLISPG